MCKEAFHLFTNQTSRAQLVSLTLLWFSGSDYKWRLMTSDSAPNLTTHFSPNFRIPLLSVRPNCEDLSEHGTDSGLSVNFEPPILDTSQPFLYLTNLCFHLDSNFAFSSTQPQLLILPWVDPEHQEPDVTADFASLASTTALLQAVAIWSRLLLTLNPLQLRHSITLLTLWISSSRNR